MSQSKKEITALRLGMKERGIESLSEGPMPYRDRFISQAWAMILIVWFGFITLAPDPRPLSAPEWAVEAMQSFFHISDAVARAITTILLRSIGFGVLGVLVAISARDCRSGWVIPSVLLASPVLAICSQWINYQFFPVIPQIQLSVTTSLLGAMIGLALSRNMLALAIPVVSAIAIFAWGTSTAVSVDLATASQATSRHILEMAHEIPVGDERFVSLVKLAFAYAEDNSHGTDPIFTNKAAILSLGIILGDEEIARRAKRDVDLSHVNQMVDIRSGTTLGGRHDLSRHFWVSAGLVIITDANRSLTLGLGKEMMDSTPGGSGFSFVDMMANRAGILFASSATRNQSAARQMQLNLRDDLVNADFLPGYIDLPEGLYRQVFQSEFGGLGGTKTRKINAEIGRRLKTAKAIHAFTDFE